MFGETTSFICKDLVHHPLETTFLKKKLVVWSSRDILSYHCTDQIPTFLTTSISWWCHDGWFWFGTTRILCVVLHPKTLWYLWDVGPGVKKNTSLEAVSGCHERRVWCFRLEGVKIASRAVSKNKKAELGNSGDWGGLCFIVFWCASKGRGQLVIHASLSGQSLNSTQLQGLRQKTKSVLKKEWTATEATSPKKN